MTKFPFTDLHSFKDYVGFVKLCSPDHFPSRDGLAEEEQWTLDYAFDGLRYGLSLAADETGKLPVFGECCQLVEEAHASYRNGNMKEVFLSSMPYASC